MAAELLHGLHGLEALVRYFTLFGSSMDKDASFRETFGMTLEKFDREFMGRWQLVLPQVG